MSQHAALPPPPNVWEAVHFRLVVFPQDTSLAMQKDWWKDLTGADPESSVRKKSERQDAGMFEGFHLVVSVDAFRVQWTVTVPIDPEKAVDGIQTVGSFVERKDWFQELMERVLPTCPAINRMAFHASLVQKVDNREEAYKLLDQYLRHVEVDPKSSDLLYRINRRRHSALMPGLDINRLSTWSSPNVVAELSVIDFAATEKQVRKSEKDYCAVDLDMNTMQEFQGILPPEHLPAIFRELVAFGTEIATKGDVKD
jgi:hypothetical protein